MAIHKNIPSMLKESLKEMLLVADYCIKFEKDTNIWPASGCYGYPAALLLLSIVDSIGSYVEGGNVKKHFKVLRNPNYYGLDLKDSDLKTFYNYRNVLSHNAAMALKYSLEIGTENDPVLQSKNGIHTLNLVPFYKINVKAVNVFLSNDTKLNKKTIEDINKKV